MRTGQPQGWPFSFYPLFTPGTYPAGTGHIDCALKRWEALNRFVDDGVLEIDANQIDNSTLPSALEQIGSRSNLASRFQPLGQIGMRVLSN
jgi:hypothetical protein